MRNAKNPRFRTGSVLVLLVLVLAPVHPTYAQLKAVATLPDLGAILEEVGGNRVRVSTVARGDQDPHYVPAKPSLLRRFRGAAFLLYNGMELEIGWLPLLLQGARNPRLGPGGQGLFNASSVIRPLEVPTGQLSRARGDIHPEGNPHFTLDPRNGIQVGRALPERLARLDPGGQQLYKSRASDFEKRLGMKVKNWERRLGPYRGRELVAHHRVWSYLFNWAGFRYAGVIEDKPGIPPSPAHVSQLMEIMKARRVGVVIVASYTSPKIARRIADRTGARAIVLPASVGATSDIKSYDDLFEVLVTTLVEALKG
ncbi:MAG: metal ABC transporter substrate-binding protein [Nitrospinota bacterium]|jgi:zinc/manganese transport system substrate-binding protein|nr:metal ABC transporter substrate-binding protein [Nitrospinota bacterium]